MIEASDPRRYQRLSAEASAETGRRLALYRHLSDWKTASEAAGPETETR